MTRLLALVLAVAACDAGAKTPAPSPPPPPPPPVIAAKPAPPPISPKPAPDSHAFLASIDRGPCYGTCPIYKLTVYRDGRVEYAGDRFVKKSGKRTATLNPDEVAAIDKLFTDGKFLAYPDYNHHDVTDNPTATTAYQPADATTIKSVKHYYGDRHAPESLTTLEDKFEELVHVERFIGTEAERDKLGE